MEDCKRTLAIFLSMHRCGSSLATQILHQMGMSLGPFELMGSAPSNPHGHFEALPFYDLNRQVQELAFGFPDDLPDSPEVLARFTASRGAWPDGLQLPDELFKQGRSLICALIESGEVSGFKDPRTVLTWPFWRQVLEHFPNLRLVPVSLLRSPHEIAMSLVTRRYGWVSYWSSLDVAAVHFRRQQAILEDLGQPVRGICFGGPSFLERLIEVTRQCGLHWNNDKASEVFDPSCVHQVPAVVPHEAQRLFDSLNDEPAASQAPDDGCGQFVTDARFVEALRIDQWRTVFQQIALANQQAEVSRIRADELARQLQESEARLAQSRLEVIEAQRQIIENQQARNQVQQFLSEALARELQAAQHIGDLRARVDRYEAHPVLGPAIRGGRHLRTIVHSIKPAQTTAARPNGPTGRA